MTKATEQLLRAVTESAAKLLTASSAEKALPESLAIVSNAISLDRVMVMEVTKLPDGSTHRTVFYVWHRSNDIKQIAGPRARQNVPPEFANLERDIPVRLVRHPAKPWMAEFLDDIGSRSAVICPVTINDHIWGLVGFDNCRDDRDWTDSEVDILKNLANLIGNVIVRERSAKAMEQARDEAIEARNAAEIANASKSTFLANMSHELRTPLNAILGFSDILMREAFGPLGMPRYKEYASDIHSSGAHLLSLINDLLDLAKIEANQTRIDPCMLELRPLLNEVVNLVAVRAQERRQTITVSVSPQAEQIYADERALKQILINITANAVKFTPPNGRIDITADGGDAGGVRIMVEDNGPGIPAEKLERLFTPFSQIDQRYQRQEGGTGLGLALVRGLTELHQGRAWIESEEGVYTRVFVELPAAAPRYGRRKEDHPRDPELILFPDRRTIGRSA